uniref:Uncharacterized protein n=1 Tax=Physcomitrium patens TaxID=3218 RepID=A0A2K1L321_PHYPA|nr:hypothetical protein PHYPA_003214 [Physcomitrium patens]
MCYLSASSRKSLPSNEIPRAVDVGTPVSTSSMLLTEASTSPVYYRYPSKTSSIAILNRRDASLTSLLWLTGCVKRP